MLDRTTRRRPIPSEQLARIADAIEPGMRITAAEPLPGGIATATFRLRAAERDFVLRVYRSGDGHDRRWTCRNAYSVLSAVSTVTELAPRPILLDDSGALLGEPLLIATYIDGAPLAPDGSGEWTEQFANALAAIHAVPLEGLGVVVRDLTPRERVMRNAAMPPESPDPLWTEAVELLTSHADRVQPNAPTLIHADLWFGNAIWKERRLRGLVDWDSARIGDPARDVAGARTDLRLRPGPHAADSLLELYQAARGPLHDMPFWDLLNDLGPRRWLSEFLEGYADLGAPIDAHRAHAQIEASIRANIAALR